MLEQDYSTPPWRDPWKDEAKAERHAVISKAYHDTWGRQELRSADSMGVLLSKQSGEGGWVIEYAAGFAANRETAGAYHLLLLAVASFVSMAFGIIMIVSGGAVEGKYPLAHAAATLVSFGIFVGSIAEWRAKRAKM